MKAFKYTLVILIGLISLPYWLLMIVMLGLKIGTDYGYYGMSYLFAKAAERIANWIEK